ncbi:MAG: polysaccharide biosynthesis tyrosine autokinase [Bacteroidota bacterium]|nr:polysaccharide biosynthesis tyrosine autokinase [Bacteroidota bacterium]
MKKMQVSANKGIEPAENSLVQQLFFRYWPYWPLFVVLIALSLGAAWFYLRTVVPVYEATATILIKDEKKGQDDSKTMEALNPLSSKKIVENETEILRSRRMLEEVVRQLSLYAPVTVKKELSIHTAYASCPVAVQVPNPDSLKESGPYNFSFNAGNNTVSVGGKQYPLDTWVQTSGAVCRFVKNPAFQGNPQNGSFQFSFVSVEKTATSISGALEVTPVSKLSTVIDLRLKDPSPERAEAILNTLMAVYNSASLKEKSQLAANTLDFIEKRLALIERQLDSAEKGVQRFRTAKGAVDLGEQSQLYLRSVGENDQKVSEMNVQLAVLDEVEKYVLSKSNTGGVVPASFGIQDPLLSQLVEKLYDSEIQYEKLKKTTAENHPTVVALQNEINKIKPNILDIIRNQRKSLLAGRANLNSTIQHYSGLLRDVPQQERELAEMSRPIGTIKNIYTFLLQKREEAALSFSATVGDSRLVDKAIAGSKPVSPKKPFILALALMGGLALGIAYITIREVLNSKILFRSDVESYSTLPVLGEVVQTKPGSKMVVTAAGRSFIEEQFRQIRTAVNYLGNRTAPRTVLVTSSISGEGKSFIASNLALSYAMSGRKVVIVDFDLHMSGLTERFGLNTEAGVIDYLCGKKELDQIIKKTSDSENLFVVPAGRHSGDENLSEILLGEKGKELLKGLAGLFDLVILDTTPVLAITDAYTISSWCDATIYVVRHGWTPKIHVQRLDDNAALHHLKNTGIVFNGIQKRGTGKYGFGYGYGYDYDYGYRYRNKAEKKTLGANA